MVSPGSTELETFFKVFTSASLPSIIYVFYLGGFAIFLLENRETVNSVPQMGKDVLQVDVTTCTKYFK